MEQSLQAPFMWSRRGMVAGLGHCQAEGNEDQLPTSKVLSRKFSESSTHSEQQEKIEPVCLLCG